MEAGYSIAKAFDFSNRIEDSAEIQEEEARIRHDGGGDNYWMAEEELDADLSDMDPDEAGGDRDATNPPTDQHQRQKTAALTPVQKVRFIPSYLTLKMRAECSWN